MSSMEQEETIDEFWSQRFDRIRQDILTALGANYRGDVALAIMPFDSPRYRYCKRIRLSDRQCTPTSKKLILSADDALLKKVGDEGRAVSLSRLQNKIKALNGNWADLYKHDTLIELLAENPSDKVKNSITRHAKKWKSSVEHDFAYFSAPQHPGTLSEGAKELLNSAASLTRQQAYDALTDVLFPSKGISAPSKRKFSKRSQDFKFAQHTSYRHQLALAYWLDAVAFPFSHIAAWPVASYQPSAWLMVVGNISPEEENSWNCELKKLIPLLEKWELEVETELYAYRLSEFQRRMSPAFEMTDQEGVRREIANCSRYLFYNEGLVYYRRRNGAWSLGDGGEAGSNLREAGASLFPSPDDDGPLGLSKLAAGHAVAPVMILGNWHKVTEVGARERYLLETTYHQLLNETRLLHAVMERNQLASASQFVDFLMPEDKAKRDARDGFIEGLRHVIRVHERLAIDRPLGSERLARLCRRLALEFQDTDKHDLFSDRSDIANLTLKEGAPTNIAEILHKPEIVDLIVKLREDLHEGQSNGLVHHLLLRPLSPLWLSNPKRGAFPQPIAFSGALLKSWSRGAIWLPHLYLLKRRCGKYGDPLLEREFLEAAWRDVSDFRRRVLPKHNKYSPDEMLSIMRAFSNFCGALPISAMTHTVGANNKLIVTLTITLSGIRDTGALKCAIENPSDESPGNLERSAKLIEMLFPQRTVRGCKIVLETHTEAVDSIN